MQVLENTAIFIILNSKNVERFLLITFILPSNKYILKNFFRAVNKIRGIIKVQQWYCYRRNIKEASPHRPISEP